MKKIMNRIIPTILMITSGIMLMACLNSCKQEHLTINTTGDVNMYSYLQQDSRFSLFKQIVDKAGYSGFLNAFGTYTLFAPTNDGVNAYLKANGKTSVDNIDVETAKQIIGISLIADTLGTKYFSDGKLRTPTTYGQYLITGAANANGVSTITINKQANLVQGNIKVGNGLIHVIDNVLTPATLTLAQTVEQNPQYSIFTAALKATGFYDTLNIAPADNGMVNHKFMTLIAQSDSAFNAAGFADFNALKAKYSTKSDPKNHADSLWMFVAYHIWPELSYIPDIASSDSHLTLAPLEVTTSQLIGSTVLLNNDVFNGVLEPGVELDRPTSDVQASNGVMHSARGNYSIKIRFPAPVYFDVTDQPEVRRTPGLYRVPGGDHPFLIGQLADAVIVGNNSVNRKLEYHALSPVTSPNDYYYGMDYFEVGLRFRTGNSSNVSQVTFKTPIIIKGRYKVWIDYKWTNDKQSVPVTFDGATMANTLDLGVELTLTESEAQLETRGYKNYTESPVIGASNHPYNDHVGRLVGIVDVTTTDRHSIQLTSLAPSGGGGTFFLDAIEFRPVDMDQLYPKLGRDGTLIPKK